MPPRASAPKGDPLAELAERGPRPLYVVDGEERILVDEALARLKAAVLASGPRDFNFDVYSGKDAPVARIVDAASTLPVFAPFRLVIVKDADEISTADTERLVAYAEDPSPTTVLVLVGEKFDARTRLYKLVQKRGAALRFERPKAREMPGLVKRRAAERGVSIEPAAAQALADAVGSDLGAMFAELEKLSLYAVGRAIDLADVAAVVTYTKEESVFELADAIGDGDRARALELLHAMLAVSREHPLKLLGMIARHWRRLLEVAHLSRSGPAGELAARLGLPPFVVSKLTDQARRHSAARLALGMAAVAAADESLKGGALDGERVMERLVVTLTRPSVGGRPLTRAAVRGSLGP